MKKSNNKIFVKFVLHILAFIFCIFPPVICTLFYFPLWQSSSEAAISGVAALLLVLSLMPIYKAIRARATPSGYLMWLVIFLLFFSLAKIAEQMTVIAFFGFIGNLLGALCFKIERKIGQRVTNEA